ncbi:hypothetical protein H4582DRAFT_2028506 [Lactarius indigo]|nr:hypothetical protein H4582DRAFT_2028506 [Lactarius indigo]
MSRTSSPNHFSIIDALARRLGTSGARDDPTSDLLSAFKGKARWITRLKGPFVNIKAVLWAGISTDPPDDEGYLNIFDEIMGLHPKLHEFIMAVASAEDMEGYHNFGNMITELMSDARACDTNRLVTHIVEYIPLNTTTPSVTPPLLSNEKTKRGWNHNSTAAALCPIKLRTLFNLDPIGFRNSVQSGTLRIKTGDYPCFLYPDNTVYNPQDRANGLFRGHIFIRALRSVYTGPSSAFTGHRTAARASNSEINGMKEVTPEMVAYISVQAHYALSDLKSWSDIAHSSFNYPKFFKNILKLFRNRDATWVRETLEYLTSELPAMRRRRRGHNNIQNLDSDQDSEDDTETMLAQQQDRDTSRPQENMRDTDETPAPPRSTPTPRNSTPAPQSNQGSNLGSDPAPTPSRQPRRSAVSDNPTPTQDRRNLRCNAPRMANNRRSRSRESEGDEQPHRSSLRITIPPPQTRRVTTKKRQRKHY